MSGHIVAACRHASPIVAAEHLSHHGRHIPRLLLKDHTLTVVTLHRQWLTTLRNATGTMTVHYAFQSFIIGHESEDALRPQCMKQIK